MKEVELHDGSMILLKKLDNSHDPTERNAALSLLEEARAKQLFITGLLYIDPNRPNLAETLRLGDTPLARVPTSKLRPSRESLDKIHGGYEIKRPAGRIGVWTDYRIIASALHARQPRSAR